MGACHDVAMLCVALAILLPAVTSQSQRDMHCHTLNWGSQLESDFGPNPVAAHRGKVVLVALFKGTCHYCIMQSRRLAPLKNQLISEGYTDIEIVIINRGDPDSRSGVQNLNSGNFQIIQDSEDMVLFNDVFVGGKDDFVIFDRCGQRAFFIPHPYSNLGRSITKRLLKWTHMGRHSCYCNLDYEGSDPHDVMYGDQPLEINYHTASLPDFMDCDPGDRWCARYVQRFGQMGYRTHTNIRQSDSPRPEMARTHMSRAHMSRTHNRRGRYHRQRYRRPSRRYPYARGTL